MKKCIVFSTVLVFLIGFTFADTLIVLHAGSLTKPLREVEKAFAKAYGQPIFFDDEPSGSVKAVKSVTQLGKVADIVAVADYSLIPQYLIPKYASWYVEFASNKLVIAYTPSSEYAKEINNDNWYEILLKRGVEFGFSNPNFDPCGYRTLLMFELAERYYGIPGLSEKLVKVCSPNNIKPKSVDLISGLESGELDYAFEYLSIAKQNHLKYVILPSKLNFGDSEFAHFYSLASLKLIGGKVVRGKPIVYGVTILRNAPHKKLAEEFLAFLLGKNGRKIFEENGQPPTRLTSNLSPSKLPPDISEVVLKYGKKK